MERSTGCDTGKCEGMDVVDAIAATENSDTKVVIKKITIEPAEKHFEY